MNIKTHIDLIKHRRNRITRGSWLSKPAGDAVVSALSDSPQRTADYALIAVVNESLPETTDNKLFIANAPNDIDVLLNEVERLNDLLSDAVDLLPTRWAKGIHDAWKGG